jgi:hypothetical protein
LQWQRRLDVSGGGNATIYGLSIDGTGRLVFGGYTNVVSAPGYTDSILFAVPTDGTKTGTYTFTGSSSTSRSFIYNNDTTGDATATSNQITPSFTVADGSYMTTGTITASSGTATSQTTTL